MGKFERSSVIKHAQRYWNFSAKQRLAANLCHPLRRLGVAWDPIAFNFMATGDEHPAEVPGIRVKSNGFRGEVT
jgi:hypothetical protein